MTVSSTTRLAGACAALVISLTIPAQAANSRSWVSDKGGDQNDCSLNHPCKTFQHAYDMTVTGGEVDVLDPGDYGGVTINHSIVIDGGNMAHIDANPGPVFKVGGSGQTVLRNLTIDSDQFSSQGVLWNGTGSLFVQNVNMSGVGGIFVDSLLQFFGSSPTTRRMYLENVKMNNCVYGVQVFAGQGLLIPVAVSIKNSSFEGGVFQAGSTGLSFGMGRAVVTNSLVSGYDAAVLAYGNAEVELTGSSIVGSGVGVEVQGAGGDRASAVVRIANNDIAGNTTAFTSGAGQILSFGNNRVTGNHGTPTTPIPVE